MLSSSRAAAVSLGLMLPLAAFADGAGPIHKPLVSEAPAPRTAERGECVASGPLARVASVQGDVRAVAPDGQSRTLACDDAVNACDTLVTGPGASAALLVDDAVVQIGSDARAQLSARPAPEVAVESGAARVVDTRDTAAQRVQLFTPALSASTGRGDAEISRDGERVRVCAHDEPLVVMARDGARTVPSGSCLETSVQGGLATSPAGAPAVAIGDPSSCPFYVAALPTILPAVSSGPIGPGVEPFDPPGRDTCDDPGSGCSAVCVICEDPDPGTGCGFPGSPCQGPE